MNLYEALTRKHSLSRPPDPITLFSCADIGQACRWKGLQLRITIFLSGTLQQYKPDDCASHTQEP